MSRSKTILLAVLAVVLVVLAIRFIRSGNREEIRPAEAVPTVPSGEAGPETASAARRPVTVYFAREEDEFLVGEIREISADPSPAREAQAVMAELLKGSSEGHIPAVPAGTRLEQLFITKDGTAYVDLSRDAVTLHPSGSSAELATIYAIVDSLAANIKTIKRVFILIDGEERETFNGHIRLDAALRPNYSLIAKK
jgi:spore germination protein GerM